MAATWSNHGLVDVTAQWTGTMPSASGNCSPVTTSTRSSSRAKEILDNWGHYLPKFVKVMPVEYGRALQELEKAQATSDGMTIGLKRSA